MTVCPKCGKLADKYIEFDNVLLFLDVLLLKPQAYRHVAYNLVEEVIFGKPEDECEESTAVVSAPEYRRLTRHFVLSILFEVYLKWAYEEKNKHHSMMMNIVLLKSDIWQYLSFIALLLVERLTLCSLLYIMFCNFLQWGQTPNGNLPAKYQKPYYICVLILAVFMSLIVKCLPIIMLIWPYDNASVASTVVDVVGVFATIEALKMIANSSYVSTTLIVAVATVALIVMKYLVLSYVVAFFAGGGVSGAQLFKNEHQRVLAEIELLREFAHEIIGNFY